VLSHAVAAKKLRIVAIPIIFSALRIAKYAPVLKPACGFPLLADHFDGELLNTRSQKFRAADAPSNSMKDCDSPAAIISRFWFFCTQYWMI
jgi:hypothetical protein